MWLRFSLVAVQPAFAAPGTRLATEVFTWLHPRRRYGPAVEEPTMVAKQAPASRPHLLNCSTARLLSPARRVALVAARPALTASETRFGNRDFTSLHKRRPRDASVRAAGFIPRRVPLAPCLPVRRRQPPRPATDRPVKTAPPARQSLIGPRRPVIMSVSDRGRATRKTGRIIEMHTRRSDY